MMSRSLCVRVRGDNMASRLRPNVSSCSNNIACDLEIPKAKKCIHPDRPASKACADCPRRKRFVANLEAQLKAEELEMAKAKCIHPDRPISKACADCPRRKKFVANLEAQLKAEELEMAKAKCIHPDRPISKACADCPRRKKFMAELESQFEPAAPCACSCL